MIFQLVRGELKSTDDKDVAKAIFDFFLFQYQQAVGEEINARCEFNAAVAANEAAQREYANEEWGGGFGPSLPYSQAVIDNKKREAEQAKKDLAEFKAMMNFVRDRFVEKFV